MDKVKKWFKSVYHQLVTINDTPHRKAMGLAIGIFFGILPGLGPLAALITAHFLRVNRAGAILGGILTNTWLSFLTLALSIKIGSMITGVDRQEVKDSWNDLWKDFEWEKLKDPALFKILWSLFIGFIIISFCFAVFVYLLAYLILWYREQKHKKIQK